MPSFTGVHISPSVCLLPGCLKQPCVREHRCLYPVQNIGPALSCDALKDREHGKAKVVKVSDAIIRSRPAPPALRPVDGAAAPVASLGTWGRNLVPLSRQDVYDRNVLFVFFFYISYVK